MFLIPSTIYLVLCLLVAFRGRYTNLGYLGSFLLSIFLTPVLVFIGLLLVAPFHDVARRRTIEDSSVRPR